MIFSKASSSQRPLSESELDHRKDVRSVYRSGYGQRELFNVFCDAGMFRVIKPEELDARNRAILKAEELGLLDEERLRQAIAWFFSLNLEEIEDIENRKRIAQMAIKDGIDGRRY